MPCAVLLAFALLSTDFPCEFIHNFVFISVFYFDFGGFFLFITVNRVWWLAKLDWTLMSAACNAGGTLFKGVFELLSGLSSSEGRSDAEACETHSPRGDQSNPPQ